MLWLYIMLGVVALFIGWVAIQPSACSVTRSTAISAPAEVVFGLVNDLHEWEAWSPWAKMDPDAKSSYAGSASGQGAVFSWSGNMQIGQGTMTITESRPHELIRIKLDFRKPMKGTSFAEFVFRGNGSQTN